MKHITGGLYEDARVDSRLRLGVKKNGAYIDITQVEKQDFPLVRLAIRIGVARRLCREDVPVIIDGLPRMDEIQTAGFFEEIEQLPSEQILVLTDDMHLMSKLEKTKLTYALTNLS